MKTGLLLGALLLLAGCIDHEEKPPQEEYGGLPAVYQRIAAETDCTKLHAEFDIAEQNFHKELAAGFAREPYRKACLGYMKAASERLKAVGCYR
jgi:hypothetical protein